jgi:hypothetical protein
MKLAVVLSAWMIALALFTYDKPVVASIAPIVTASMAGPVDQKGTVVRADAAMAARTARQTGSSANANASGAASLRGSTFGWTGAEGLAPVKSH